MSLITITSICVCVCVCGGGIIAYHAALLFTKKKHYKRNATESVYPFEDHPVYCTTWHSGDTVHSVRWDCPNKQIHKQNTLQQQKLKVCFRESTRSDNAIVSYTPVHVHVVHILKHLLLFVALLFERGSELK